MTQSTYRRFYKLILVACLVASLVGAAWQPVQAQSNVLVWSDPINLSKSGETLNPLVVADSSGVTHVFWMDRRAGVYYTRNDGTGWRQPREVDFPVPAENYSTSSLSVGNLPRLFSGKNDHVFLFWLEEERLELAVGNTFNGHSLETWQLGKLPINSVIDYDVVVDSDGIMHLAYVQPEEYSGKPSGVYYLSSRDNGSSWSLPALLYESPYYRRLVPLTADGTRTKNTVDLAVTTQDDEKVILAAFDNQPRNRVLVAHSLDGGTKWSEAIEVDAPQASSSIAMPGGIRVSALGKDVLLTWQVKQSDTVCSTYFRTSKDGGSTWSLNQNLDTPYIGCPDLADFVSDYRSAAMLVVNLGDRVYLGAWDGEEWGKFQLQPTLTAFQDPETFEAISNTVTGYSLMNGKELIAVGFDETGDVWTSSRSLEDVRKWFPDQPGWQMLESVQETTHLMSNVNMVADADGGFHAVWSQAQEFASTSETEHQAVTTDRVIYYAYWDGGNWSRPVVIERMDGDSLIQPVLSLERSGRILLTWKNASNGELYLSWVTSKQAGSAREWAAPVEIPIDDQNIGSAAIAVDSTGRIIVAYNIPINEKRGVYLISSDANGTSWGVSQLALDGSAAGLGVVSGPQLLVLTDGSLHLLVGEGNLDEENQPQRLFYLRSTSLGSTWSSAELVSRSMVGRYRLAASGGLVIHRFWQEASENRNSIKEQVSNDGGLAWSGEVRIVGSSGSLWLGELETDVAGQIHLVQTVLDDERTLTVQYWSWEGKDWKLMDSFSPGQTNLLSTQEIALGLSSLGRLGVLVELGMMGPSGQNQSYSLLSNTHKLSLPAVTVTPATLTPSSSATPEPLILPTNTLALTPTVDIATLGQPQGEGGGMSSIIMVSLMGTVLVIGLGLIIYFRRAKK